MLPYPTVVLDEFLNAMPIDHPLLQGLPPAFHLAILLWCVWSRTTVPDSILLRHFLKFGGDEFAVRFSRPSSLIFRRNSRPSPKVLTDVNRLMLTD
jgi:hypothetical protein